MLCVVRRLCRPIVEENIVLGLKASRSALLSYFLMLYPSHPRSPFSSAPNSIHRSWSQEEDKCKHYARQYCPYALPLILFCVAILGGEMVLNV